MSRETLWQIAFNACKFQESEQRDLPKPRQSLVGVNNKYQRRYFTSHGLRMLTLSRLDIGGVRYVTLYADQDILEFRECDGGRDVVRDALLEQNRRIYQKVFVCGEGRGKGGGVILSWGMRDDIGCPSRNKGHGR